jgi:hypothetical protein
MKKVALLVAFILLLALAGLGGELYIEDAVRNGYTARLTALEMQGANPKLAIVATVDVTNTTSVDGTFAGLEGVVSVQGADQDWKLLEPTEGAALAAGETIPLRLEVTIAPMDAVKIGLAALAGGGLDMRFDGTLRVEALGFWSVAVELHDRQTLRPTI